MKAMQDSPSTQPPSVAIIILTWNGRQLTMECLDSLRTCAAADVELVVVDNASSDGTVAAIRDTYGETVTVIENDSNLGFARGNNVGIEYALGRGARYILLLNNDTAVAPDLVQHLVAPLESDPGVGITTPKILFYTPPDRIWFAGGEVYLARGVARHTGIRETDRGQFDQDHDTDYATGCALMARREVYERVGLLDPGYVAYFEDTDFCMRARRAGWRIRYAPAARVWHKISASTGGQLSRRKVSRKFMSTWMFFRRYARPWHWLSIPLFFAFDVVRIGALVAFGRIRDTPSTSEPAQAQNRNREIP
jgi:GT2 family glycosyltransferase